MIESRDIAEHLLEAVYVSEKSLRKFPTVVSEKDGKDLVTSWDIAVHESLLDYFEKQGIRIQFLGEEGSHSDERPEIYVLVDEIDGTQNAVNALPFGINIAAAPYKADLSVQDLTASVVANLRDGRKFIATKGNGFGIIERDATKNPVKRFTDIWEVPLGYVTLPEQRIRQTDIYNLFLSLFGPQYRSIDATGPRLAEITDRNLCAYADWRDATKPWDVLPSWLILKEGGFVCTDILGFSFDEAYLTKDNDLNMKVGKNFLAAAKKNDHAKALFGIIKTHLIRTALDDILSKKTLLGSIRLPRMPLATFNNIGARLIVDPVNYGHDLLRELTRIDPVIVGQYMAGRFNEIVEDKKSSYGIVREIDIISFKNVVEVYLRSLSPDGKIVAIFEDNIKRPLN